MQRLDLTAAREESGPTVAFDGAEPRTVLLTLDAGERVPRHDHPGRTVVCAVRSGRLRIEHDDGTLELGPDDVVRFDGARSVSLVAVETAEALVVLPPAGD